MQTPDQRLSCWDADRVSYECVGGDARRTVDDLSVGSNVFGMFVAGLAVVSSGMQQIYVGTMQAKHKLNANELLSNTAPAQARSRAVEYAVQKFVRLPCIEVHRFLLVRIRRIHLSQHVTIFMQSYLRLCHTVQRGCCCTPPGLTVPRIESAGR